MDFEIGTFSLSQMSKRKLAFVLPWREKVHESERSDVDKSDRNLTEIHKSDRNPTDKPSISVELKIQKICY